MAGERWTVSYSVLIPQILAKKVYTLYSLAVQQLSRQDHYDFGLRALTSLLRYAGKKRRLQPELTDEEVDLYLLPYLVLPAVTKIVLLLSSHPLALLPVVLPRADCASPCPHV